MEIKDIQGNILIDVPVTESAVKTDELMKQHNISLSWSAVTDNELPLGSYIEYEGIRYSLLSPYRPQQKDEVEYEYKPVFEHPVMRWQYLPFLFYTYNDGRIVSKEPDWSLTDNAANFMAAVVDAIKNITGEQWSYEIADNLPASASLSFNNTDIFSALSNIAAQFETEWWFDYANKVLYLSKASHGEDAVLEVGKNIGVPSITQSKEGYYTRFLVFGSTRNIEQEYKGANTNSIVNRRLTLDPAKYPDGYIDIKEGLTNEEILSKTLVFDDIYPRSALTISDVKVALKWRLNDSDEKIKIGTDAEGNPVYDQYAVWYFKIPNFKYNEELVIPNKPLSVHFNNGPLQGREFELWHEDEEREEASTDGTAIRVEKGDYRIKYIEEGSFIIPAITGLIPVDGNSVTLFNITMPEEYKASAYDELEKAALKEIAKQEEDASNYSFGSNSVEFLKNNPNLSVGRKVVYKNGNYTYSTRVIKLEVQLDRPFEQKITIGNEQIKGNTQTLKEEVVNATQNIDLIATINESTQQLVQSYQRTQKALQESMAKWGDMWSLDAIKGVVRTRYNIVSEQEVISNRRGTGAGSGTGSGYGRLDNWAEWDADTMMTYVLSAKLGVSLNERLKNIELNGSGLKEDDLKKYLDDNKYLQEGDITELKATVDGLDDLLNGGTKEVIDTWNEVVAFLDGYKDSEDLATILSGMNTDIANRVLYEDFEKLEEAVLAIDISGLSKRLDVAEQAIKTNATAIATNATNITNLNNRVKTLEDLGLTLEGDAETGYYIKSAYSFVSQGEIISGRRASGSGSGGGGGISEITAQMVVDALGYVPYSSLNPAGYITSSALNGYAKTSDIPSLSGYATENWVGNNYQPKGNYLTSVSWDIVGGKPTTLGGYGITDALPLSGGTLKSSGTVPLYLDSENTTQVITLIKSAGVSKAQVGWDSTFGTYLYNYSSRCVLGVKNDGTPYFGVEGSTLDILIHSNNIGLYNAGSATKLQDDTAFTAWGQTFFQNGVPKSVSGDITLGYSALRNSNNHNILSSDGYVVLGFDSSIAGYATYIDGSTVYLRYGTQNTMGLILNNTGNVLIGTTYDAGNRLLVAADNNWTARLTSTKSSVWFAHSDGYGMALESTNNSAGTYLMNIMYGVSSVGYSDGITAFKIKDNGNVLIGTPDDYGYKLYVNGNAYASSYYTNNWFRSYGQSGWYNETYSGGIWMCDSDYVRVYNGKSFWCEGNIIATGEVISSRRASSSDARLKDNINRLIAEDCLAMVRNLQPSSWQWKEDGKFSLGFIAQDIEPLMPYAVTKIKDEVLGQRLNLQYDQFLAPVVGAIQCLDSEVEQLKKRVKYLENKLQEYGYNRY